MRRGIELSPFLGDLVATFVTSVLTIIALVASIRILAAGLGPEAFGAYSIARRLVSTIEPLSTFTMGVALTRYLSIAAGGGARSSYLLAATLLAVLPALGILAGGWIWKAELARLLFAGGGFQPLFTSTLLLIFGYSFFILLYSLYRGRGQMLRANAWQLAVIALGPLILAWIYADAGRADRVVLFSGCFCAAAILPLSVEWARAIRQREEGGAIRRRAGELWSYSLPRIPGGFAFPGILAVGPFLAPYFGSLKHAGFLLAGQSILRVVEGGTEAFSRVALPKIARLHSAGDHETLRLRIEDILSLNLHVGLFATLQLIVWSDQLVYILLGSQYLEAGAIIRVVLVAIVPYLAYSLLRSVIDAVDEKAVNSANACIALAVTAASSLAMALLGMGIFGLAAGMAAGLLALGALTVLRLNRLYRLEWGRSLISSVVFCNAALLGFALMCRWAIAELELRPPAAVLAVALIELCFGIGYLAFLWKMKAGWILELRKRIAFTGPAPGAGGE